MKLAARLVAVVGAVAVAWLLFGHAPRDVKLVYDVSSVPDASALEVEIVRGDEVLRHAEFRLSRGEARAKHEVKLPEGDYLLRGRIVGSSGATPFERPLEVHEAGTIVLPLGR